MINNLFFKPHMAILEQGLSASSLRHRVISNNIANVNTPNFKKSEVSFEGKMQAVLQGDKNNKLSLNVTNKRHISANKANVDLKPEVHRVNNTTMRTDGNNVDIDIEMAGLAKNSIYYQAVAQQLNRNFAEIKSAINEGRR